MAQATQDAAAAPLIASARLGLGGPAQADVAEPSRVFHPGHRRNRRPLHASPWAQARQRGVRRPSRLTAASPPVLPSLPHTRGRVDAGLLRVSRYSGRPAKTHWVYEIFDYLALEVPSVDELKVWRQRLIDHNLDVTELVSHGMIMSIYFHDPVNGIRLKLTNPTEPDWNSREEYSRQELENWVAVKEGVAAEGSDVTEALLRHSAGRNKFGGSHLD